MGAIDTYPPQNVTAQTPVLGYAQNTAGDQVLGNNPTETTLTGLSVTVVVPAGRRLKITIKGAVFTNISAVTDSVILRLKEDGVDVGAYQTPLLINTVSTGYEFAVVRSPTAGSHTYTVTGCRDAGTGTTSHRGSATEIAFILVEDITGSQLPVLPQSVPVGVLGIAYGTVNSQVVTTQWTDITSASVNVVVPAGRTLRISGKCHLFSNVANDRVGLALKQDGGATPIGINRMIMDVASSGAEVMLEHFVSPTAGAHTFSLAAGRDAGTGAISTYFDANTPIYICVEDVTSTPAPGQGAPGSTLGIAQLATDFTAVGAGPTTMTDLTVTVTVPAGRRLKLTGKSQLRSTAASNWYVEVFEDGVNLGRLSIGDFPNAASRQMMDGEHVRTPAAGTHTYDLRITRFGGTGDLIVEGSASWRALLVEDITGAVWPVGSSVTAGMVASEAWTDVSPVFSQGVTLTYTKNYCRYQRIGRTITLQFDVSFTSSGTAANNVSIALPFAAAVGGYRQIGLIEYFSGAGAKYMCAAGLAASTTVTRFIYLHLTTDAVLGANPPFNGQVVSGHQMTGFLSYEAAS